MIAYESSAAVCYLKNSALSLVTITAILHLYLPDFKLQVTPNQRLWLWYNVVIVEGNIPLLAIFQHLNLIIIIPTTLEGESIYYLLRLKSVKPRIMDLRPLV